MIISILNKKRFNVHKSEKVLLFTIQSYLLGELKKIKKVTTPG